MVDDLRQRLEKLTKKSFEALEWQQTIHRSPLKVCHAYHDCFRDQARQYHASGQIDLAEAALALQIVSMLRIRLGNPRQPFRDPGSNPLKQIPDADVLPESLLALFAPMAAEINDPEFKARLADVCWTSQKQRNFSLVTIAIEGYVASATALAKPIQGETDIQHSIRWESAAVRLRRAIHLAIGTKHKLLPQVQLTLDSWLTEQIDEIPLLELATLLTDYQNEFF
jgi:hypothetical protein